MTTFFVNRYIILALWTFFIFLTCFSSNLGLFSSLSSFPQSIWDISQGENKHFALNAQKYKGRNFIYLFFSLMNAGDYIYRHSLNVTLCHLLSPHMFRVIRPRWLGKSSTDVGTIFVQDGDNQILAELLNWHILCYFTFSKIQNIHTCTHTHFFFLFWVP